MQKICSAPVTVHDVAGASDESGTLSAVLSSPDDQRNVINHVALGEYSNPARRAVMGKGIFLWLLGVPLPIILLLALFWH